MLALADAGLKLSGDVDGVFATDAASPACQV